MQVESPKEDVIKTHIGELVIINDEPEVSIEHTGYINYEDKTIEYNGENPAIREVLEEVRTLWENKELQNHFEDPSPNTYKPDYIGELTKRIKDISKNRYTIILIDEKKDEALDIDAKLQEKYVNYPNKYKERVEIAKLIRYYDGIEAISEEKLSSLLDEADELEIDQTKPAKKAARLVFNPRRVGSDESEHYFPLDDRQVEIIKESPVEKLHVGELVTQDHIVEIDATGWMDFKANEWEYTGNRDAVRKIIEHIMELWDDKALVIHDHQYEQFNPRTYINKFKQLTGSLRRDFKIYTEYYVEENSTDIDPTRKLGQEFAEGATHMNNSERIATLVRENGGLDAIAPQKLSKCVERYTPIVGDGLNEKEIRPQEEGIKKRVEENIPEELLSPPDPSDVSL